MSSPSISVMKFGTALIFASHLRQSCSFAQYCASFCIVANCTPCVASPTCSRSGHFVATMRLRKSASSASAALKLKARIAPPSAALSVRISLDSGDIIILLKENASISVDDFASENELKTGGIRVGRRSNVGHAACLLCSRKRTYAVQYGTSAWGQ